MKKNKILLIFILFLILLSLGSLIIYLSFSSKLKNISFKLDFDEDKAYRQIKNQLDIGNRIPGSDESNETIYYFIEEFQEIDSNITYTIQKFEVDSKDCQNLLFKFNEKEDDIIILSAHYDSRAKATKDKENSDKPVPGANDGASGCAVLLELARVLYSEKNDLKCQLWFVFFDAEDQGKDEGGYGIDGWEWCEGSNEFVKNIDDFYDSDDENLDCLILFDMVGGQNLQFIKEQYSTSSLVDELFEIGRQLGYYNEFPILPYTSSIIDDHVVFSKKKIPTADLIIKFWDNPNWPYHHTTRDDIDHISKKSLEVTGRTVEQFIYNNYLDKSWNNYEGNKPWNIDIDVPNTEIIVLIIIIAGVISCSILFGYINHKRKKMDQ